jgi:bifunctional non-homologous end joining protein LigD
VATPVTWDELDDPGLRPDGFTVADVPSHLAEHGDPWQGMGRHGRSLAARVERLQQLLA